MKKRSNTTKFLYKNLREKKTLLIYFQEERRRLQAEAAEKRLKDQEVIKEINNDNIKYHSKGLTLLYKVLSLFCLKHKISINTQPISYYLF